MLLRSLSALAVLGALSISAIHAEERFPAGGLVLDPAAKISVAKEDVYLSIRQVRVHYDYTAETAQKVALSFPNPIVPIDEGPDHLGGSLLEEGQAASDYTLFSAKVDGKPVDMKVEEFAFYSGVDITAELAALGVPAYIQNFEQLQAVFAKVDPAKQADLVKRGILMLDSYGQPQTAMWLYQSVLSWDQEFAAGTTAVDIAYVPLNGYPQGVDPAYYGEVEEGMEGYAADVASFYCLDAGLFKAVKTRMETQDYFETVHLGFEMRQEDRATKVGEFSLTVDKADTADLSKLAFVAFCPIEAKKVSDTAFRWTAKDFTPSRDVDVVYYAFYPSEG